MERLRRLYIGEQPGPNRIPEPISITQSTGIASLTVEHHLSNVDLVQRVSLLENKMEKFERFFSINTASLNTLGSDKWELRQPLIVSIENRGESDFVACLYDFNLYGYGDTIPEALDDLKEALLNQFEYLLEIEGEARLGSSLKRQLKILKNNLVNIDV